MIIGLNGHARAGKDTAANLLAAYGWQRVAFADRLKAVAYDVNPLITDLVYAIGWDRAKTYPGVREFLQRLGVAVRDHIGEDTWVNAALDGLNPAGRYVVTDVRFPNEADAILSRGGMVVRITRPGVAPANGHVSESALAAWPFDAVIANDGSFDDLERKLLAALSEHEV